MKSNDNGLLKNTFKKQLLPIIFLIIGYGAVSVASVLYALFSKNVVDAATAINENIVPFIAAAIIMAVFGLMQVFFQLICRFFEERIKARLESDMKSRFFSAFVLKKYSEQTKFHSGEVINRLSADSAVVADGVMGILPHFVQFSIKILLTLIVLLQLDVTFTLILCVGGVITFMVLKLLKKTVKKYHKLVQESEGRLKSKWQEILAGLSVFKAFSAEDKATEMSDGFIEDSFKARLKRRTVGILSSGLLETVFRLGSLFAIVWGGFQLFNGNPAFTFGTFTAVLQLVSQINQPFAALSNLIPKYYQTTASAERLAELSNLEDEKQGEKVPNDFEKLVFENVTFKYPNREETVLENASFEIKAGEFVSFAGKSGGGKTTAINLLLALYSNYTGSIKAVGKDFETEISKESRSLFAYVPQSFELFSGTVKENVTFGRDFSEKEINDAISISCAEFVSELPQGIETVLSELGTGLSEGQRQRLSICRAVLHGAPVLLLDEATSALDAETEKRLLKNLRAANKTVIAVSHRTAALKASDKILQVKDKKITEKKD